MNLEHIWQEYRASLKAFLHSRIANPADVDDLLQEILIKTFQNLDTVKEQKNVKSWLFQIANNTIIDFYRKKGKEQGISQNDLWYVEDDPSIHQQLAKCISPFIQALPQQEADMLTAIEINGQSQKAYAEKSGTKYSTLKSRVHKSREKLYRLFKDCCELSLDSRGNIMDCTLKSNSCKKC